jgi:phosphosulfolactate phosphohydrolase-like enzyme
LLNRSALCQWLADLPQRLAASGSPVEVWCVCAGTDGQVAWEDVFTAGAIIDRLVSIRPDCQLGNDASAIALAAWKSVAHARRGNQVEECEAEEAGPVLSARLVESMRTALGGRNLVEAGFDDDLRLVASIDSLTIVPRQERACRFVR